MDAQNLRGDATGDDTLWDADIMRPARRSLLRAVSIVPSLYRHRGNKNFAIIFCVVMV
jgi:hypothetical protein